MVSNLKKKVETSYSCWLTWSANPELPLRPLPQLRGAGEALRLLTGLGNPAILIREKESTLLLKSLIKSEQLRHDDCAKIEVERRFQKAQNSFFFSQKSSFYLVIESCLVVKRLINRTEDDGLK